MNKLLVVLSLLIMLAIALYFSQSKPKPQVESLQGLDEELNSLLD